MFGYKLKLSLLSLMGISLMMCTTPVVHASLDSMTQQTQAAVQRIAGLVSKCIAKNASWNTVQSEGNRILAETKNLVNQVQLLKKDGLPKHAVNALHRDLNHVYNQLNAVIGKAKQARADGTMKFINAMDGPVNKLATYMSNLIPAFKAIKAQASAQSRETITKIEEQLQAISAKITSLGRLEAFSVIKALIA